jgi:tetratricopeptide (TPR) repeat protein
VLACALSAPAPAQEAKNEVSAVVENGFARLVFTLPVDIEPQVKAANGIIVITFPRPVAITVDKLAVGAQGYISAARRDPDGRAIRIALARKVTVNSMAAAERLFVDLLPEGWTGLPPGLPREVIEDLARRAREADKKLRQQRVLVEASKVRSIRVRVATLPTFTRYVFELPELIGVASDNQKDKLTLTFNGLLKFDLADAKANLPAVIGAVDTVLDQDSAIVSFTFAGKVDVRTFREDLSFIVDVTPVQAKSERGDGAGRTDELSAVAAELAARTSEPPAGPGAPPAESARPPQSGDSSRPPPPAAPATTYPGAPAGAATAPVEALPAPATIPAPPGATIESAGEAAVPGEGASPPPVETTTPQRPEPAPGAAAQPEQAAAKIAVSFKRHDDNLSMVFAFAQPTPAAVFLRADTLWLVFDTDAAIGLEKIDGEAARLFKSVAVTQHDDCTVVRLKLERPLLVSASADGPRWIVAVGNEVIEPTQPIGINRNIVGAARASIVVPLEEPRRVHRFQDPDAGDALLVVTALGPPRGLVKAQEFVELRALTSAHGLVVQPIADDLDTRLSADRVVIGRPAGMTLSPVRNGAEGGSATYQPHIFDAEPRSADHKVDFNERSSQLIRAAAQAPEDKRAIARAALARFYLGNGMAAEAKAVLDVSLADDPATPEDPTRLVLRGIANAMIGHREAALKDLGHPFVGNRYDAPLWRAFVHARQGRWSDAREGFRAADSTLSMLPLDVQRMMIKEMVRSSIAAGDITGAVKAMHDFEAIGVAREDEASVSVLGGRIAEGLGRVDDALRNYQAAADSGDRPAASQARLRLLVLQRSTGTLRREEALSALESLTAVWRGDETEVEALALLARLYTEEGRYRDAFQVMRTALAAHPNSEMTRRIHEDAAATFDSIFLTSKGDSLPAIEALALFYDFRELTPIGRRGDEMIRRLADRLVAIDLLEQAAELLQHQVEHRLHGAARAQVAAHLAVIELMNRKPDRALASLRATRAAELSNDLRRQRLMLEARALSDLGRHGVALEVVADIPGPEAIRLRADIVWAARRWREAAEQIELLYGDRWQEFTPLGEDERRDILRAGVGYVLGEDPIGLGRLRERYAAKLDDGPDGRAFEVVTAPVGALGDLQTEKADDAEFRAIAHAIASIDTLDAFLRDMHARFPQGAAPAGQAASPAAPASGKPDAPATALPAPTATPPPPPTGRTASR